MNIPLVRPAPPQLSLAIAELQALEQSGIFSNFGPINTLFEQEMMEELEDGEGLGEGNVYNCKTYDYRKKQGFI